MRNFNNRIYFSMLWIVSGTILFVLGCTGTLDSFWSGMGGGLLGVGMVQTARWMHYRKDPAYKEKYDVSVHDERNRFLSNKAWAWAGYLSVLIGAAAVVVCKAIGLNEVSTFCSIAVCLLVVLYWACYLILKRKY